MYYTYYYYYYYYYYYWYSALGPVWTETRAQSGDWYGTGTLHPGQILRGSLPLLPPRRERSQRWKVELWARMLSGNFVEMTTTTPYKWQPSSGHCSLKTRIWFSLNLVNLYRKHSGDAPSISILIKAVYLVSAINSVLWHKKRMDWTTLKYVRIS
jgi:hypothetical protein